jgi:hypothetical protein
VNYFNKNKKKKKKPYNIVITFSHTVEEKQRALPRTVWLNGFEWITGILEELSWFFLSESDDISDKFD